MIRTANTVIIGAGISGLFTADGLLASKEDFLLISGPSPAFGGYALVGGMKIGMPPAGRKAIEWVGERDYDFFVQKFISAYGHMLQSLISSASPQRLLPPPLSQKFYQSFFLPRSMGYEIARLISAKIKDHIIHSSLSSICRDGETYILHLRNGAAVRTKNVVIASGRNLDVLRALEAIGQGFHSEQKILFGCRGTFDPVAPGAVNNQIDLKVRDDHDCTTYCFNFRGRLHRYRYNGHRIFSGTLDPASPVGNAFFGKRIDLPPSSIDILCRMQYNGALKKLPDSSLWDRQEVKDIHHFIDLLKHCLSLKVHKVHFPALEQFWPFPLLNPGRFESRNLEKLFMVGDASGICFGILQCFVSAGIVTRTIGGDR